MLKKLKHAEEEAKKLKHAEEEAKKLKHAESEEDEAKHAESEEDEAKKEDEAESEEDEAKRESEEDEADPEQDPEHADVAKDKELILSMIKKYMGSEEEPEEAMHAAHEAYEAYKEMGEEEDEAMKCAAKAMKLAKHMASKRSKAAEGEKCEDEAKKEVVPQNPKADPEKYVGSKKENEVKLAARVAFLEKELKKRELAELMDKKLKESGLGRAETDKIRTLIGAPKSETQISDTIKIFKEAFGVRGSESTAKKGDFFVTMERAEAPVKKTSKVDFSDL